MRQTALPLEGILEQLVTGTMKLRPCLLTNELGEIAKETKASAAIEALCGLLQNECQGTQYAAYGYLQEAELTNEPGVQEALRAFETDSANVDLVSTFRSCAC